VVVLPVDLYRAGLFKEKNKEKVPDLVLADLAGIASALYGVSGTSLGMGLGYWQQWNDQRWVVIDRKGKITSLRAPVNNPQTELIRDVDLILDELRKASR
jgi:hypothetical protein